MTLLNRLIILKPVQADTKYDEEQKVIELDMKGCKDPKIIYESFISLIVDNVYYGFEF